LGALRRSDTFFAFVLRAVRRVLADHSLTDRQVITAHAKGQAMEGLLAYAFEKYPGIRLIQRNAHVAEGSEEIDLVFWNDRLPNGLPSKHFDVRM
jgi:hypothetical protein